VDCGFPAQGQHSLLFKENPQSEIRNPQSKNPAEMADCGGKYGLTRRQHIL
jgi:hypothetical protein